jgi:hypothetical protein
MWRDTNERAHADLAGELFRKTKAKRKNRRGEGRTMGQLCQMTDKIVRLSQSGTF